MHRSACMIPAPRVRFELKKIARAGGRILVGYDSFLAVEASQINIDDLSRETKIIILKEYPEKVSVAIYTKKTAGSYLRSLLLQFRNEKPDPLFELIYSMTGTEPFVSLVNNLSKFVPVYRNEKRMAQHS